MKIFPNQNVQERFSITQPRVITNTVSQESTDVTNSFFACWCKFRKAKSHFDDFWVDVVTNGRGHLVYQFIRMSL